MQRGGWSSDGTDHPRLRGEHRKNDKNLLTKSGSPPPTRGTQLGTFEVPDGHRITPAYAGNTIEESWTTITNEDHPRLRGEHFSHNSTKHFDLGSPPPTRGTLKIKNNARNGVRITPAYAGNTDFVYIDNNGL